MFLKEIDASLFKKSTGITWNIWSKRVQVKPPIYFTRFH